MHLIQDDQNNHSHGSSCQSECGHHAEGHRHHEGHCHEKHCHDGHDHHCSGENHLHEPAGKPQVEALLSYMLEHNQHHALELEQMAKKLAAQGMEEAAAQIDIGVQEFQKGNMHLSVALALVKEQQQEV